MSSAPNLPAGIFAGIVAQAATALPESTGTVARIEAQRQAEAAERQREAERLRVRMHRAAQPAITALLLDVSGSMEDSAGGGRSKHDVLRTALHNVAQDAAAAPQPPQLRYIAFSSHAVEIAMPALLPSPAGGTALHLALMAAEAIRPAQTIVFSDGQPDDEEAAIAAAGRLSGSIDVIYCGPDNDAGAIAFMRRLARVGCGRVHVHDLRRDVVGALRLEAVVRNVLLLPAADGGSR